MASLVVDRLGCSAPEKTAVFPLRLTSGTTPLEEELGIRGREDWLQFLIDGHLPIFTCDPLRNVIAFRQLPIRHE